MIHRLTLPAAILRDYQRRGAFERYHRASHHAMMDDISVKASTDELKTILADAEYYGALKFTCSPNLTRAYVRMAEKIRAILRNEPAQPEIGRDGKTAASEGKDYEYD